MDALKNTIIVLIGFAGTGKYTIGRELCSRTGAKLIDNHLINNSIFTAVNADGLTPLPAGVWDKVKEIRRIVYEAIREMSAPETSFVFTLELRESDPGDHKAFFDLVELASARGSLFVPVRLICEEEELCRRVTSPARIRMLKQISAENTRKKLMEHSVLKPQHPNLRTIDVTKKSPGESTDAILDEVNSRT
jgi:hypothetical protein